jgi:subfamily B ATP-binding cassette protein MsbA
MDEATSALDSETEKSIQDSIDALKGKYTILLVAHRLSTIKNADQIVFMKKGKIENVGTFQDLLEQREDFKRMVELQEI